MVFTVSCWLRLLIEVFHDSCLVQRSWNVVSGLYTALKGMESLACHFRDLKIKDFISACSISIPGNPRSTKHYGLVNQPQVAEQYLQAAAAIDIHNHNLSGSAGLEIAQFMYY